MKEFFDQWIYGAGLVDWSIDTVKIEPDPQAVHARIIVKQLGEINEPTCLGFQFDKDTGYSLRVPLDLVAGRAEYPEVAASVERVGDNTWQVDILLPAKPKQIAVDPDKVLLDRAPHNNHWHMPLHGRNSPVYTMVDETDLFNGHDTYNVIYGPWLYGASYADPWYTRSTMFGLRAGLQSTAAFSGGLFTAYRSDIRDIVAGGDFLADHWPWPHTQFGGNFEHRLAGPFGTSGPNDVNRAALFGRYVFQYGSSFYLPPIHYAEVFATYQDDYLPYARTFSPGAERPEHTGGGGVHYHLNLLTPYWNPETGLQFDATYSGGVANFARNEGYQLVQSQLSGVQRLGDGFGWFSDTRIAGRVAGAAAAPGRGQFFALGGGTLFRGFDLAERQGSAYWLASAEARLPVIREARHDICDHLIGLRNLYVAGFYDVGDIYNDGHTVGGVAHALGAGLRFDITIFSIMERSTLRIDAAKTVNAASPVQFWFGFQHPF